MRTRTTVALSLAAAVAMGFLFTGPMLAETVEGLDASAYPLGPEAQALAEAVLGPLPHAVAGLVVGFGGLLLLALVAFLVVRRTRAAGVDPVRRSLLAGSAAGVGAGLGVLAAGGAAAFAHAGLGLGRGGRGWANVTGPALAPEVPLTHEEWLERWKGSRIRAHRRLGRTGFRVSDIVAGAGPISGEKGTEIVRQLLDRGVNYIDTAPDYSATGSEEAVGRAIRGRRDGLFLATKFCTPIGHLPAGSPVRRYTEVVEGSLRRLGTDYVDLVHVHSCDSVERILDPNLHEAFDRLREAGKARFLGFSSHTPRLEEVAEAAIASGRFDVMMLAYHHGAWRGQPELIRRAREEQDMGVVAMKTLKGARHHGLAGFREHADAYSQAAFKWVLSNPDVSCVVISFREFQHVDEYLYASGAAPGPRDLAILEEYDRQVAGTWCSPHCGECLPACPEGVPIPDVLRHRMYFEDYGHEREGIARYAALPRNAAVCAGCPAPCAGSCPAGIPIRERLVEAHRMLSLDRTG